LPRPLPIRRGILLPRPTLDFKKSQYNARCRQRHRGQT